MRFFQRGGGVPAALLERAGLPRGEKVLAHAAVADGAWVLGTRRFLVLVPPDAGPARQIPWEQVEDASWDQEASRLRVNETGSYGQPQPAHAWEMTEEPALLLQLVRERVMASIVLQRRVEVRGQLGLTVIGRRSPVGGAVAWMHAYDAGLDPDDPEVRGVADAALDAARAEVGDDGSGPI